MSFPVFRLTFRSRIGRVVLFVFAVLSLGLVGAFAKKSGDLAGAESSAAQSFTSATASTLHQPNILSTPGGAAPNCTAVELDETFGVAGRVVTSFPGGLDTAKDVVIQGDGKIVVAGSSGSGIALVPHR